MWLSGISGYGARALLSYWENTIKSQISARPDMTLDVACTQNNNNNNNKQQQSNSQVAAY